MLSVPRGTVRKLTRGQAVKIRLGQPLVITNNGILARE